VGGCIFDKESNANPESEEIARVQWCCMISSGDVSFIKIL
jgi:hypothetical protein